MDLNGDGFNDILSGSYSRTDVQPMAGLFQVLRGLPDGTFAAAEPLLGTDGEPLIIPSTGQDDIIQSICTRPVATDWDCDGDLDLVVGNFAGSFHWFSGDGGGKFSPSAQPIKIGDKPLALTGEHVMHSDPFPVDWDGDGDLDLLSGTSAGGVQWAENTAGKGKLPLLKAFAVLIPAPGDGARQARPDQVQSPAPSTRVWATDVNSDGKLDILLGDQVSLISPAQGVSEADFTKRFADWNAEQAKLGEEMARLQGNEAELEKLYERMSKSYEERSEFMTEEMTGFVWLYVQK